MFSIRIISIPSCYVLKKRTPWLVLADFRKSVLLAFGCCSSGKTKKNWVCDSVTWRNSSSPKKDHNMVSSRFLFLKCVVVWLFATHVLLIGMWFDFSRIVFCWLAYLGVNIKHVCFLRRRLLRNVPARAICTFCVESSMKRYEMDPPRSGV